MNEQSKRPWFLLHRSTLLVLAASAGLLGWYWFGSYDLVTKAAYYDYKWFPYAMVTIMTKGQLFTIGWVFERRI